MAYKINTIFTANYDSLKNTIKAVQGQFNSIKIQANNFSQTLKNDLDKAGGAANVLDKGVRASAIGVATITLPMLLAGKGALNMAGQFESSVQTLEFTLGKAKTVVDDFVSSNATALGMAEQDAYKFANVYSNLLTTMTNDQTVNAEMTNKLLMASSVIMSKTGRTFTDVADRIRSGLLGNTEAIEDLGVNVNVALLESTDAFKQMADGRSWDKLSFKEQQQIRLLGILEQTSKKYGEEVGQNLSLELSKNAAMFKNVQAESSKFLSEGLKPLLGVISNIGNGILVFVKYLNTLDSGTKQTITTFFVIIAVIPAVALVFFTLIKAINSFNTTMATSKIMSTIFGKGIVRSILGSSLLIVAGLAILCSAFGGLGNVVKNIGSIIKIALLTAAAGAVAAIGYIIQGISILIPGFKNVADSTLGFANSLMGTAKSMSNQIKSMGNTAKSSNTAGKAVDDLTEKNKENEKSAKDTAKANKELADNLQGFDEINKLSPDTAKAGSGAGDTASPGIGPNVDLSGMNPGIFDNMSSKIEGLKNTVENLKNKFQELAPVIALVGLALIGLGIAKFIMDIANLCGGFSNLGLVLKPFLGIGLIFAGIFTGIESIKKLLDGDLVESFKMFLLTLGLVIAGVAILVGIVPALIVGIVIAIAYLITVLATNWDAFCLGFKVICETVGKAIGDFFQGIVDWVLQKWLEFKTGWDYICEQIGNFFMNTFNGIKNFFSNIWNWICEKASAIGNTFSNVWENIKFSFESSWTFIKSIFSGIWNWICDKASSIGNTFSNVWESIKNGFINLWNTIKNFASSIGTTVANAVGGTIQSVVNGIIGFAENTINKFIRAINSAIGLINAIPGVNIGYLNKLSIPRLNWYKNGGVFGGKSVIGVAEYANARSNPEIVSPRNMMYDTVLKAIDTSNSSKNNGANEIKVVEKVVKIEVDMMAGGVRTGKRIIDLLRDTDEFYDLGLEF